MNVTSARTAVDTWLRALGAPLATTRPPAPAHDAAQVTPPRPATYAFPRPAGTPRGHAVPGIDATADALRSTRAFPPSAARPTAGGPYLRPAGEQHLPPAPRTADLAELA